MLVNRRLARLVALAPRAVGGTVVLAAGASLLSVAQWVLIALVLSDLVTGANPDRLLGLSLAATACVVGRALLFWLRDLSATRTAAVVKTRVREQLVDKLAELGPGYTVTRPTGTIQTSVADGVEALDAYVGFYLPQAAVALLTPVILVATLTAIHPGIGAVVTLAVGLTLGARQLWQRVLGDRARAHWAAYGRFAGRIHDTYQGMVTLKTAGASARYGDQLAQDAAALYRATLRNLVAGMGVYVLTGFLMGLGTAVATLLGALSFTQGSIGLLGMLLILVLSAECFRPVQELQNYWHEGFGGLGAAAGIFALLDAKQLVADPHRPQPVSSARPVELSFCGVSFTYPGSDRPALDEVSFEVAAGHTVAVVGPSGSGKSTVAALCQKFFSPDSGSIRIAGVPISAGVSIADCAAADVRRLISTVSQDCHLFYGTIADNLRLARPAATAEELVAAADAAGIGSVIAGWEDGYQTVVGERGATLSGGERQRVAIARALLADAPILILDEATSSVDVATQAQVSAAVERLTAGRTTLVIAHRLNTLARADQVVVLDRGRVVQQGSPRDLSVRDGLWAQLVDAAVQPV